MHDPPLLSDADGSPLPELAMAVKGDLRGQGVGTALVEALASEAAHRFQALTLNVHLANRAVHLYMRTGFRVVEKGRGWFGVAMSRSLDRLRGGPDAPGGARSDAARD
jgi:GNAT superfamily N-acetyltransferase